MIVPSVHDSGIGTSHDRCRYRCRGPLKQAIGTMKKGFRLLSLLSASFNSIILARAIGYPNRHPNELKLISSPCQTLRSDWRPFRNLPFDTEIQPLPGPASGRRLHPGIQSRPDRVIGLAVPDAELRADEIPSHLRQLSAGAACCLYGRRHVPPASHPFSASISCCSADLS